MDFDQLNQLFRDFKDLEQELYLKDLETLTNKGLIITKNLKIYSPLKYQIEFNNQSLNLRSTYNLKIFDDDSLDCFILYNDKWLPINLNQSLIDIFKFKSLNLKNPQLKIILKNKGLKRIESENISHIFDSDLWFKNLNISFTQCLKNFIKNENKNEGFAKTLRAREKQLKYQNLNYFNLYHTLSFFQYSTQIRVFHQLFFDIYNNEYFSLKIENELNKIKKLIKLRS